jgi:Enoyl-CoA hydratase/isomerase
VDRPPGRYTVDNAGIARVTLDHPGSRNALGDEMLDALLAAFGTARADVAVRVVVLGSSHDRVFCAGGDLKAFASDGPPVPSYLGLDRFPRLFTLLAELGKAVLCLAGDAGAGRPAGSARVGTDHERHPGRRGSLPGEARPGLDDDLIGPPTAPGRRRPPRRR